MDKLYLVNVSLLLDEFKKVFEHLGLALKSAGIVLLMLLNTFDQIFGFVWKKPLLWKTISPTKRESFDPSDFKAPSLPPKFFRSE